MTKSKHPTLLLYGIPHCHRNKKQISMVFCTPTSRYLQERYFLVYSSFTGSPTALKLGRKYCQFHTEITLEIPHLYDPLLLLIVECSLFFNRMGRGDLLCLCSSETRKNKCIEEKNRRNSSLENIFYRNISLPGNPQNCPQEFFLGEVRVIMKFTLS